MMNERIKKAIQEFEKAKKENSAAADALKVAEKETENYLDKLYGIPGAGRRFRKKTDAEKTEYNAILKKNADAEKAAKMARAVVLAASQNVANIASNVLLAAVRENPGAYDMPVHYKKFKTAIENVLNPEDFWFSASEYSFTITFRGGEYNHNDVWLFSVRNGVLVLDDDRDKMRLECTLAEIKKEARRAFRDAEKLRAAVNKLAGDDARKNYKTHVAHLMPYFEKYNAIRDNYKIF